MAQEGLPVRIAASVLGVTESGYFAWRSRPPSARSVRHSWLTDVITAVHAASNGTYGYRRIHEELTSRHGIAVSRGTVQLLMRRAGIRGSLRGQAAPHPVGTTGAPDPNERAIRP
ncbi:IS3 family transposase [Streptomyces tirandamycinicus]|uniref:IS3 family transposase n=1 Tax=Streptomyces tirandamycinicus TaxID=2174846 RepID=UPI000364AA9C